MKDDIKLVLSQVKAFFSKKRFILLVVGIFFILGIFTAIFSPKSYQSSTSFLAQLSSDSGMGTGLKSIASLIGLSVGKKSESKDLPVFLYPKIMNSLEYQREIMETKIKVKGLDSSVTLKEYYTNIQSPDLVTKVKKYTVGLPRLIISKFKSKKESIGVRIDSLEYVSIEETMLINRLKSDVIFGVDEFDGTITISATMPENIAASQVAENAKNILQNKIIEYRIAKAQERFKFIDEQYEIKKQEFFNAQSRLANYSDRNMFNNTRTSLIRKQQLENEYSLAYQVYSELESQRIRESINLNEDTPVFTTIQPAVVPVEPTNGNPLILVLKFIIIGFIASIFLYVIRISYTFFKTLYKSI